MSRFECKRGVSPNGVECMHPSRCIVEAAGAFVPRRCPYDGRNAEWQKIKPFENIEPLVKAGVASEINTEELKEKNRQLTLENICLKKEIERLKKMFVEELMKASSAFCEMQLALIWSRRTGE